MTLKEKAKVLAGEKKSFNCKFTLKDKNNDKYNEDSSPLYKIDNFNFFRPSIDGSVLDCRYEIKVSLYFENFVDYNHRPRVIFPINVVHETLEEHLNRIGMNNESINSNSTLEATTPIDTPNNTSDNGNKVETPEL